MNDLIKAEDIEDIKILDGNDVEVLENTEEALVETEETKRLRNDVQNLLQTVSDTYWSLAESLAKVMNGKFFKLWGFGSFEEYLIDECGLRRGKGYALVKICNYFSHRLKKQFSGSPDKYKKMMEVVKQIGWAKARLLATDKIITVDNVDAIMEAAQSMSVDELEAKCKEFLGKEDESDPEDNSMKSVNRVYRVTLSQAEILDQATQNALKTMKEGATPSSAMTMVCQDFLSNTVEISGAKDRKESIAQYMSKIERAWGCCCVVFDPEKKDIIYGEDNLQRIAEELDSVEESVPF